MAAFWMFNLGRSKACGDAPPYQQMWRWKGTGKIQWTLGKDGDQAPCPHDRTAWEMVTTSDPHGGSGGWSDDFVGVYGNWWGVAQSGGRWIGEHGIGPADCPYIDALDEVAQDHDINCYLAVEADRLKILQVGDFVRIENVWKKDNFGPKAYAIMSEINAHLEAGNRVSLLPSDLRKKLEKAMEKAPFYMRKIILGQGRSVQPMANRGAPGLGGATYAVRNRVPGVIGLG